MAEDGILARLSREASQDILREQQIRSAGFQQDVENIDRANVRTRELSNSIIDQMNKAADRESRSKQNDLENRIALQRNNILREGQTAAARKIPTGADIAKIAELRQKAQETRRWNQGRKNWYASETKAGRPPASPFVPKDDSFYDDAADGIENLNRNKNNPSAFGSGGNAGAGGGSALGEFETPRPIRTESANPVTTDSFDFREGDRPTGPSQTVRGPLGNSFQTPARGIDPSGSTPTNTGQPSLDDLGGPIETSLLFPIDANGNMVIEPPPQDTFDASSNFGNEGSFVFAGLDGPDGRPVPPSTPSASESLNKPIPGGGQEATKTVSQNGAGQDQNWNTNARSSPAGMVTPEGQRTNPKKLKYPLANDQQANKIAEESMNSRQPVDGDEWDARNAYAAQLRLKIAKTEEAKVNAPDDIGDTDQEMGGINSSLIADKVRLKNIEEGMQKTRPKPDKDEPEKLSEAQLNFLFSLDVHHARAQQLRKDGIGRLSNGRLFETQFGGTVPTPVKMLDQKSIPTGGDMSIEEVVSFIRINNLWSRVGHLRDVLPVGSFPKEEEESAKAKLGRQLSGALDEITPRGPSKRVTVGQSALDSWNEKNNPTSTR